MKDIEQIRRAKEQCLTELTEHLPDYAARLTSIDPRLLAYIEDAISNNASHANVYELLGIRKEFRRMDSYNMDSERVLMSLRAIEGIWENGNTSRVD